MVDDRTDERKVVVEDGRRDAGGGELWWNGNSG